jgi:hypothetical protein
MARQIVKDSWGALDAQSGRSNLWLAIGAAVIACVHVFSGISGRIKRTEEFHITT